MTLNEAKKRTDYIYSCCKATRYINGIRNNNIRILKANDKPISDCASLQIGCYKITLNMAIYEQFDCVKNAKRPVLFYEIFQKPYSDSDNWKPHFQFGPCEIDWNSKDWMKQLETDLFNTLNAFLQVNNLDYDKSDESKKVYMVYTIYQYDGYDDAEIYADATSAAEAADQLLSEFLNNGYTIDPEYGDENFSFADNPRESKFIRLNSSSGDVEITMEEKKLKGYEKKLK